MLADNRLPKQGLAIVLDVEECNNLEELGRTAREPLDPGYLQSQERVRKVIEAGGLPAVRRRDRSSARRVNNPGPSILRDGAKTPRLLRMNGIWRCGRPQDERIRERNYELVRLVRGEALAPAGVPATA